jgi:uncharacterized protein DUF6644
VTAIGAIETSALGQAMRDSSWLFPAVKVVHLTGVAALLASIVVLDLRLLGCRRSFPVRRLAKRALPWAAGGFLLIVPSGFAMFVADAGDLIANPVFALKICLIFAALTNAAVFHAAVFRGAAGWDVDAMPPALARASAALSLALWISVFFCGRLLAST